MESDPEFFGPAALAKGFRFVGDPRLKIPVEQLERYNDGLRIWDYARYYFCNSAAPGRRSARRDRQARRGVDQARDRPRHGCEARAVVRPLGEDDGLAPRDRARPQTQGVLGALKETKFALALFKHGKVPLLPHVAKACRRRGALYEVVKAQDNGAAGIVQTERALARLEQHEEEEAAE